MIRESLRQAREVTPPGAWDALPAAVRRRIAGKLRGRGDAPHDAVTTLESSAAARVDWRAALRTHVGSILGARPSFRRPPRRQPELAGVVAGRAWQRAHPRVLAVIDTSGSMSPAELELVAGELSRLGRTHDFTVAACDARIHAAYRFPGRLRSVSGGGGTDLRPPLAPCLWRGTARNSSSTSPTAAVQLRWRALQSRSAGAWSARRGGPRRGGA